MFYLTQCVLSNSIISCAVITENINEIFYVFLSPWNLHKEHTPSLDEPQFRGPELPHGHTHHGSQAWHDC